MSGARRAPPEAPRPDHVRSPREPFGWLEARWLHEGHLARLGPNATAVLLLLALAADRKGASFFSRARMAERLSLEAQALDRALDRLLQLGFVAQRPWRPGDRDGVWQLLPLPAPVGRRNAVAPIGALLACLGLNPARETP